MLLNDTLKKEEVIIAQQTSLKKLRENISYVIQTDLDTYYNDQLNFSEGSAELTLKEQRITLFKKNIKNVWQVLDRSEDIVAFLKKANVDSP